MTFLDRIPQNLSHKDHVLVDSVILHALVVSGLVPLAPRDEFFELGRVHAATSMARQNGAMVDHFISAYARFVFGNSVLWLVNTSTIVGTDMVLSQHATG